MSRTAEGWIIAASESIVSVRDLVNEHAEVMDNALLLAAAIAQTYATLAVARAIIELREVQP